MNPLVCKTSARSVIVRALVAVATCALLTSCRVDSVVTLDVEPNGSGTLAVVTTVDAEVVARVPNIAQDLSFEDAKNAGWKVVGLGHRRHTLNPYFDMMHYADIRDQDALHELFKGQTIQLGDLGLHCLAPNSIMAWL